ncbi:Signal transduction histidine kinase [Micromonospora pattaloongensis]|uniref:histidine kinase n=1 Tax=Micromonospora pattaloongensis TaxID=405436 RepID=A0A1H3RVF9_9ACTN|nr:sensor histidine kinase [Micromonospora pattaloongensis]SDZ28849.1 Signal transduction histidine kinase [Micromonospora pattaloongensis]
MSRTVFGRPLRSVLFDVAVSAWVVLFAVAGVISAPGGWKSTLIGVAMAVALLFRRAHPSAVGAVVAALALVQVILDWEPLAFDVAVLVAMYSVVKYADRLRDGLIAGVVGLIGVAIAARGLQGEWWAGAIFLGVVCGAVWLAALNVRTRRLYVLSLEERAGTLERERDAQARAAVAEERTRIARELHDVVAHSMAVMIVQADGATYMFDRDPDTARAAVKTVAETGRQALEEMRRLVGVLRDPTPAGPLDSAAGDAAGAADESGAALSGGAQRRRLALGELDGLLARSRAAGLTVRHTVRGEPVSLPPGMELSVYRLVQESLTNALKHAGTGAHVDLVLDYTDPGFLRLRVTDDGRGRGVGAPPSGGHGLVGMRERVAVYGGEFHAGPRLDGGWEIDLRLPLPSTAPQTEGVA